jgi:serine/threonine protein kinase/Tol biopolymer transport system component
MTPDLYRQASDIFNQLREVPQAERAAALELACAGKSELRAEVLRLLASDSKLLEHSFLQGRAMEDAASLIEHQPLNVPPPDTVIGNYRLGKRIGNGGMGVVFQAQDLRLDRRVALKILEPELTSDNTDQALRFQREARAVSMLSHPNIVSVFDAGFEKGWFYIAMELVEGKTLRQVISSGAPRPDRNSILEWMSQAAAALSAAHEANIVHRDIKPENIILRSDGFVKVVDFGLAKLRDSRGPARASDLNTRPGDLPGTILYLSPEQILGQEASPRSDLFALGIVAYELATGIRPFDGPTNGAIFNSILHHHPLAPSSLRPELGQDLDELILRLLEKDPELRFQTALDLRSSCRRISRDSVDRAMQEDRSRSRPVTANHALNRQRSLEAQRTNFRGIALAVLAGIVFLGAGVFWLSQVRLVPHVISITQITNDGSQKDYFVTDGLRIYYAAGHRSPGTQMFQVGARGGDPVRMAVPPGMFPLDVSPDGSELLLGQDSDDSLWVVSTVGGPRRRLGDLTADGAQFSPKGDAILYFKGPEVRIARSDGSDSRLLTIVEGNGRDPAWSPDGRSIRFTRDTDSTAVWEMASDGTHLRRIFPEIGTLPNRAGKWTGDGNCYVFSVEGVTTDLWASRERPVLSVGFDSRLVRLTNGPIQADHPKPTADGRRVFFRGRLYRGELVRYDKELSMWSPYLQGLAATQLDFSRDGKWVAYVSYPEGCVWRCGIDGSARLQLTSPPLFAQNPRWSPDGTQIVFYGGKPGEPYRLYLVPSAGGAVRQLTHGQGQLGGDEDGNWSADGSLIAFGGQFDAGDSQRRGRALGIVDVATGRVTKLPGSEGMWSPRWSFDGRHIAALRNPGDCLFLYDPSTHNSKQLTTKSVAWPSWSRDSKFIYFASDAFWRIRIDDGKQELVPRTDIDAAARSNGWTGVTPDGGLLSTRDKGSTEIYALEWSAP